MKLKNKKRFMITIVILSLIILFIILFSSQTFSQGKYEMKTIYISNGDTLWDIALIEQKYNRYYEDKKIKEIIQDIKYINNLDSSYIYEGQQIEIPTI